MKNYKYLYTDAKDPEQYVEEVGVESEEIIATDYKRVFIGNHKVKWRLKGQGTLWLYYLESIVKEEWEINGDFTIYSIVKPENYSYLKREVKAKGKVEFRTIALGNSNIYSHYYIENWLEERGIAFLNKNEKTHWYTLLSHEKEKTHSYSHIRGILNNSSYAKIEGLIWIKPQAKNANSYLDQHVMLLSDESWAFTWPALRIENNEVRASHSATISKIPEEMLFYLAARGLSKKDALTLLIKGFTSKVFDPPRELWEDILKKL